MASDTLNRLLFYERQVAYFCIYGTAMDMTFSKIENEQTKNKHKVDSRRESGIENDEILILLQLYKKAKQYLEW